MMMSFEVTMIVKELQPAIPFTCTGRLITIPIVPINMIIVATINESIHMYAVHVSVMHYIQCQPWINKPLGWLIGGVPFKYQIMTIGGVPP